MRATCPSYEHVIKSTINISKFMAFISGSVVDTLYILCGY